MGFSSGSSSSNSSSYGYNQSLAESIQNGWGPQAGPLSNMYQAAGDLAGRQAPAVAARAGQLNRQVMPGAMQGFNLMQQYATPNSDLLRRQTADLADVVGTEFGRTIMPQIRSGAGVGGNMGGSREALARGVAAGDAASAISRGATDLFANAWNTGSQAASMLPGMAGDVSNLGMMPFQAAGAPWSSLAGVLGGPTTLSRSRARSVGEQASQSVGKSSQFGFNIW